MINPRQRIIEVLEDHTYSHRGKCECGAGIEPTKYEHPADVARSHLAEKLLPLFDEAMAAGWEAARHEIKYLPCWYTDKDHHGFDLWTDENGEAQESGARITVMEILDNNPYRIGQKEDR